MKIETYNAIRGKERKENPQMALFSAKNRVFELKKNKSKVKNAWKKEARKYS